MSIITELLTSNSRRARVFRIFPYLMLGLIGLDYLFSKQLDTSVPKEENSPRIIETVAVQKVNTSLQDTEADDHETLKAKAITNTIERIESICLHKKPLPIHKRKANYDYMSGKTLRNRTSSKMKPCENLDKLGQVKTHLRQISLEEVDNKYPIVKWGGLYSPRNCTAKYKVAIIIPYRDRRDNLAVLLNHLHPFLIMQKVIEYGIFVVEQFGTNLFNRGKLMNIAVVETDNLQPGYWECFIFHDADLLPENSKNLYSCPKMPRHMASAVDIYEYKLRAEKAFGGVIALTRQQFYRVNGFSNSFWGWGGEDNDMVYRLDYCNYNITRYRQDIGRYIMLRHSKPDPNPLRYDLILSKGRNYREDGLTTLNYRVVNICQNHLFTHILVDIDFPATAQDIE